MVARREIAAPRFFTFDPEDDAGMPVGAFLGDLRARLALIRASRRFRVAAKLTPLGRPRPKLAAMLLACSRAYARILSAATSMPATSQ